MQRPYANLRRFVVSAAILAAVPLYFVCGIGHLCMAGHMQHGPYPAWHYLNDLGWVVCFIVAAVLCWRSNLRLRKTAFLLILLLFMSRIPLGSAGGMLILLELPLIILLAVIAVRGLRGGMPDPELIPDAEKRRHRRAVLRGWAKAVGILVIGGLVVWAGLRAYRALRRIAAKRIAVESVPFSRDITMSPGDAYTIALPEGKTIAIWCVKNDGIMLVLDKKDIGFKYGEVPFKDLKREEIRLPDGAITGGEYFSYIRQGAVMYSETSREFELFVEKYRVGLLEKNVKGNTLDMTVSVRLATDREQISPKNERAHFLKALESDDPAVRFDAVHELGELVTSGSTYAGDCSELREAVRSRLRDPDQKVRDAARNQLRGMGDDEALLEMLTPRPIAEFAEPNGAWTIAGWCRQDSDKVPRHVVTYFDSNDPKLHEFALAFFSCYKIPYPPAQPYVVKHLKSDIPAVRTAAASAIRFTCDNRTAVKLLYDTLGDTNEDVLVKALIDATYFSDSIPTNRIAPLLNHKNPEIRALAGRALRQP